MPLTPLLMRLMALAVTYSMLRLTTLVSSVLPTPEPPPLAALWPSPAVPLPLVALAAAGSLILNDGGGASNKTATLSVTSSLGQGTTYTLPDPGATTATICLSTGNCAGSGNGITGSGTAGVITKFTGTGTTIGNSSLSESGTTLTYAGNAVINAANGFSGNLLNVEVNNSSELSVDQAGDLVAKGNLTAVGGTFSGAVTVSPTTSNIVGLTVNATTGSTSAVAAIFNQANNTSPADTVQIKDTSTGTQTNDLLISRSGAGTTTNLLNLTNASGGTATNGLTFSGTFGNLINADNFTVNNSGQITLGGGDNPDITTVVNGSGVAGSLSIQPATTTASSTTGASLGLTGGNDSLAGATGGSISIDAGTGGSGGTNGAVNIGTLNAASVNIATNNVAHTIDIGNGGSSTAQTFRIAIVYSMVFACGAALLLGVGGFRGLAHRRREHRQPHRGRGAGTA